jgi:tartrate dehydratase beta subunit/fumarate hydratase class I family protein
MVLNLGFQHDEGSVTTSRQTIHHDIHKSTRKVGMLKVALVVTGVIFAAGPMMAVRAKETSGTAGNETSQQTGQQSLGVQGGESSNVIMGGSEIIVGTIEQIQGEEFSIRGDLG